jgi:hypothetical protein
VTPPGHRIAPLALTIGLTTVLACGPAGTPELPGSLRPTPTAQPSSPAGTVGGQPPPTASNAPTPSGAWHDLIVGDTVVGLRAYGGAGFPTGWIVEGGELTALAGPGVDLVTATTYAGFELEFGWRVTPGGNSGVIYRVIETLDPAWVTGPENQVLDDDLHPDGRRPETSAAALYDLLAPNDAKVLEPVGEVNRSRIVVTDGRVEHWLNSALVLAYEWASPDIRSRIASSKFAQFDAFMSAAEGHVVFQHHGEEVAFRDIRIRRLGPGR